MANVVNTGKLTAMAKRGYSRAFTPQTDRRVRFEIDRIPPTLYEAVKAKAKREGVSLRALTLQLWKDWAAEPVTVAAGCGASSDGKPTIRVTASSVVTRRTTGAE